MVPSVRAASRMRAPCSRLSIRIRAIAQIGAPGERPVIGQQHGIMIRDERLGGVAQRGRAGRAVGNHRHLAHQQRDLGKNVAGDPFAGHREAGGGGRVRMHYRATVGPATVDP